MKLIYIASVFLFFSIGFFIYTNIISGRLVEDLPGEISKDSLPKIVEETEENLKSRPLSPFIFDSGRKEDYNQLAVIDGELYVTARFSDWNLYYYKYSDPNNLIKWSDSSYPLNLGEELNLIKDGKDLYGVWYNTDNNYERSEILFKKEGGGAKIISDTNYIAMTPVFFKHSDGSYWVFYGDHNPFKDEDRGWEWYTTSKDKGKTWSKPKKIRDKSLPGEIKNLNEIGAFEYNKDIYVYAPIHLEGDSGGIYEIVYDYDKDFWNEPVKVIDKKSSYIDMDSKAMIDSKGRTWIVWDPAYSSSIFYWAVKENGKWSEVKAWDFGLHQDGDVEEYNGKVIFFTEGKMIPLT